MNQESLFEKKVYTKNEAFEKAYSILNESQKKAVDTIEGPVMVVAGPGTGKTQVIAMRTANILQKTHMQPSNILLLTFSNNGVKAMRERLRSIIGSQAYGVMVSTIHSFCNDIIQKYPEVFIEFKALEQVSEIERLRIIRAATAKLGPTSILGKPMGDKDRAADVLSRINQLKRDGILVEDLKKLIPDYEEDIKTTPTGRSRDLESKSYKDDQRKVSQFTEFVTLYSAYNKALLDSHRYDYNDMILMVIKALKQHDWLLAGLQEQYMYIQVDEFQDLNGAQNKVIESLIEFVHTDQEPNIFAVGDDDQAIFRFQGASVGNMNSFIQKFSSAEIVCLDDNYRSTQSILDASSIVIEENKTRLAAQIDSIDKKLTAHTKAEDVIPKFLRYPDQPTQYAGIVELVKKKQESGESLHDIAIICRKNDEVRQLADVLFAAGVPSQIVAKQDMMTHHQVREMMMILRAIHSIDTSHLLASALALDCFGCHPADLGKLWIEFREENRKIEKGADPMSLHAFILLKREELSESIVRAYDLLLSASQKIESSVLPELIQNLLLETTLLPSGQSSADPRIIAGLHSFYDYVKNRCYEQKSLTLDGLLADFEQYLSEPSLKLEFDMPHLVSDGVQLMTAHGSKGLEFSTVIIPNAWYGNWGNSSRPSSFSLPDHLIYDIDKKLEKVAEQEDERRLFYVAMTRAKNSLYITFPETYRSGEKLKDAQVSSFIADAQKKIDEISIPVADLPAPIEVIKKDTLDIDEAFTAFLQTRLEHFELSVTALNSFLDDPEVFLWEQLLQQPRAKAAHLAYGTAVHAALESRNIAIKSGEEFDNNQLIIIFESYLGSKELMTQEERVHYLHVGKDVLTRYIQSLEVRPLVVYAERTLRAHLQDSVLRDQLIIPLKGKVDRIDVFNPDGRACRIIDYKTGAPKKTEEAIKKDEGLFRQIVFYKILADNDASFTFDAELFTFDFVGNEKEDRRVIDLKVTEQEVQDLTVIIEKVWKKITSLDFTPIDLENS